MGERLLVMGPGECQYTFDNCQLAETFDGSLLAVGPQVKQ